jgi:hypothetical protein
MVVHTEVCKTLSESLINEVCPSATPSFKNKNRMLTICMPGSSLIHIATSSVNNSRQCYYINEY